MHEHAVLSALCVHLKEGWMSLVNSTRVWPAAVTKHLGASPGSKTVAGAAVTVQTRAVMAKERMMKGSRKL